MGHVLGIASAIFAGTFIGAWALVAGLAKVQFAWTQTIRTPHPRSNRLKPVAWPLAVREAWLERYPHRTAHEFAQCAHALGQYLYLASRSRRPTALPSAAADSVWHLFLEMPEAYSAFCRTHFGRPLHHVEGKDFQTPLNEALLETWCASCLLDRMDRHHLPRTPTLFALDRDLRWKDGFHYRIVKTPADGTGVELRHPDGRWHLMPWSVLPTALLMAQALAEGDGAEAAEAAGTWVWTHQAPLGDGPMRGGFLANGGRSGGSSTPQEGSGTSCGSSCGIAMSCGSCCGSSCGGSCGGGD